MTDTLSQGAVAPADIEQWLKSEPAVSGDFAADGASFTKFWSRSSQLLGALPQPAQRQDSDRKTARSILEAGRKSRVNFLRRHVDAIYDELTAKRTHFVKINELIDAAAQKYPGLVPSPEDIAAEEGLRQSQKAGLEIDQGLFISAVLRSERSGRHFCHAMLLPREAARRLLPKFIKDGHIDLPGASIERHGKGAIVTFRNPRFLNAEDQTTLAGMETCVDLALLDDSGRGRGAARHAGRASEIQGPARVRRGHQSHAPLSRPHSVSLVSRTRSRLRQQALSRAGARRRRAARRVRRPDRREAVDRRGGGVCHRRPLPDLARGGLRARREDRLSDAARAQGGHHPRRRQHAAAARGRRPHRAAGDPVREAARMRQRRRGG